MTKKSFLLNKYTLSVVIVFVCLLTDIILHKGITRVLVPEKFTDQRAPVNLKPCASTLLTADKHWIKGVNTLSSIMAITNNTAGFETDVYFDTTKNYFLVYHDSTNISDLNFEKILRIYQEKKLTAGIWLDFKNLSPANTRQSLNYLLFLRKKYGLNNWVIESSSPSCLPVFCENGFFTSYYTPYINPYQVDEKTLIAFIDTIHSNLSKYRVSALSGYYFQYPVLKKYFPNFPILTWVDNAQASLVANSFDKVLSNDDRIKIVLSPVP